MLDSVCKCSGCRLIDDIEHFQPGEPTCVLGGFAAGFVEMGRDGDHDLLDWSQFRFTIFFNFSRTSDWMTSGGSRSPLIVWEYTSQPMSRLANKATRSGLHHGSLASLPTTIDSPSNKTTLGVVRSPSAFGIVVGRPAKSR